MNDSQTIETISQITQEMLRYMLVSATVQAKIVDKGDQEIIWINVEPLEDPRILIGQKGTNLASLQHLVRLIARRKVDQKVNFVIDVNKYKEKRINYLTKIALSSAAQVIRTKAPIILDPMSPYERRIVHLALANHDEVETESTGPEGERKVMIKLKSS